MADRIGRNRWPLTIVGVAMMVGAGFTFLSARAAGEFRCGEGLDLCTAPVLVLAFIFLLGLLVTILYLPVKDRDATAEKR